MRLYDCRNSQLHTGHGHGTEQETYHVDLSRQSIAQFRQPVCYGFASDKSGFESVLYAGRMAP